MNEFSYIILVALLLNLTISTIANALNLKALKLEPPTALKDIYKQDDYRKSQGRNLLRKVEEGVWE